MYKKLVGLLIFSLMLIFTTAVVWANTTSEVNDTIRGLGVELEFDAGGIAGFAYGVDSQYERRQPGPHFANTLVDPHTMILSQADVTRLLEAVEMAFDLTNGAVSMDGSVVDAIRNAGFFDYFIAGIGRIQDQLHDEYLQAHADGNYEQSYESQDIDYADNLQAFSPEGYVSIDPMGLTAPSVSIQLRGIGANETRAYGMTTQYFNRPVRSIEYVMAFRRMDWGNPMHLQWLDIGTLAHLQPFSLQRLYSLSHGSGWRFGNAHIFPRGHWNEGFAIRSMGGDVIEYVGAIIYHLG